jgi:E3 ubiquitin-protein ligase SHPRH
MHYVVWRHSIVSFTLISTVFTIDFWSAMDEDLLTIVEQALISNHIEYVRPKGQSGIGACAKRFRGSDIPVLILNVKCGAEGLSLIEATHVFMVEPLLHCGLDAQAINRVHRIGQKSVTHVHRYIVEDTIEVKIDALRMEMQENHEEDELGLVTKDYAKISAGGIDGGFSASQLKDILK